MILHVAFRQLFRAYNNTMVLAMEKYPTRAWQA